MRQSELYAFNKLLKTLVLEPKFNGEFTKDQNWEDVPFKDLKVLKVPCFGKPEKSYRNFSTPPNWFQILKCVDEILVINDDYHHKWIGGFTNRGRGTYYVGTES
jgi:hypothetical protein